MGGTFGMLFTTMTLGKDFTMMNHALMPMRLETDTIGRFLGNGVLAMVAPGNGMTPPMWSSSGCGYLLRWMPMSIQKRAQAGFSGALKSRVTAPGSGITCICWSMGLPQQ